MEKFSDILIPRLLYVIYLSLSLSLWKHFRIFLLSSALVGVIFIHSAGPFNLEVHDL